jgi:hypothetical protein
MNKKKKKNFKNNLRLNQEKEWEQNEGITD